MAEKQRDLTQLANTANMQFFMVIDLYQTSQIQGQTDEDYYREGNGNLGLWRAERSTPWWLSQTTALQGTLRGNGHAGGGDASSGYVHFKVVVL